MSFKQFIKEIDFSQVESTNNLKFKSKSMQELAKRCWIMSGNKIKDFMSQFKMGKSSENFDFSMFDKPITKQLKEMENILQDLIRISKNNGVTFQMWYDLWENIFGQSATNTEDCFLMVYNQEEYS